MNIVWDLLQIKVTSHNARTLCRVDSLYVFNIAKHGQFSMFAGLISLSYTSFCIAKKCTSSFLSLLLWHQQNMATSLEYLCHISLGCIEPLLHSLDIICLLWLHVVIISHYQLATMILVYHYWQKSVWAEERETSGKPSEYKSPWKHTGSGWMGCQYSGSLQNYLSLFHQECPAEK